MVWSFVGDTVNGWNLSEAEWSKLVDRASKSVDALEDGAFVRANAVEGRGMELRFYASSLNKPESWRYAFTENVPGTHRSVATVGRAWHHAASGFVEFEVEVDAAVQALIADYEGGAGDFDDATLEQEIDRALRGTPADRAWVMREFARLIQMAG